MATLVNAHGASTEAKDLLHCIRVDWRKIEKYDKDILKRAGLIQPNGRRRRMTGFDYIREYYGVPAEPGAKVEYNGKPGTVTGTHGPHVKVRLEWQTHSHCYHPRDLEWHLPLKARSAP